MKGNLRLTRMPRSGRMLAQVRRERSWSSWQRPARQDKLMPGDQWWTMGRRRFRGLWMDLSGQSAE
eukprot:11254324-Prorocentrum_lima.AAC.1